MNYVKYRRYWGTEHFRTAGLNFQKERFYCPFPEGTNAYQEYWDEHEYYIKNGYEFEGQRIAGLGYLYVNFCPIWRKKEKKSDFPDFRSPDMEWFGEIEKAMAIGPYANTFNRPSVHATAKTRQSGHSLKGCVPLIYNTHFVPYSKNYLGSYDKSHAIKTNSMFWIYQRHLFEHTDFRKRLIKTDTDTYYKFGLKKEVNGIYIDAGYQTELSILSFQDKTTKGVGGGVDLFVIEEAGVFPKLIEAIQFIQNAVKDGDLTTGTILVYGAAGNLSDALQFEKLATSPTAYDAYSYVNSWDPEATSKGKVIYFVPNYSCRPPHIDPDGNPMEVQAIVARDKNYAELKIKDYSAYLQKVSQEPNNLREMFDIRMKTRFDREMIAAQIAVLEANPSLLGDPVEAYYNDGKKKMDWRFSSKHVIRDYPIPDLAPELKEGCPEMYELPTDHEGSPGTRYVASIDSYNQEEATTSSYGSLTIYELANDLAGGMGRRVVLDYLGRPQGKDGKYKFYEICLAWLRVYNALCLPENEDQELTPWFYNKGYEHYLADQPEIIRNYIPNSKVKRLKGIHADEELIIVADNKQDRWFKRTVGHERDEEGKIIKEIRGIDTCRQLGYLREAYRYVRHKDLNFDRIRSRGWTLMMEEEIATLHEKQEYSEGMTNFLVGTSSPHKGIIYDPEQYRKDRSARR